MSVTFRRSDPHPERGIALVSSLLVLLLISVLGTTFIATTVSERAMSSNVQVARASLLSADAGVRVGQQALANLAQARLNQVLSNYSGSGPVLGTRPDTLFPAGVMTTSSTNPNFTASYTIAWADTNILPNSQQYSYRYTVRATGSFGRGGQRQVESTGMLVVSADRGTFAQFLIFTNQFTTASGGNIWFTSDGHFDGRVHTNGEFKFAYQPEFLDKVSSVNNKAWYYNKGNPKELAANNNGTIDVPQFYGGFQRGAPSVPLPTNSYNQQATALGLTATGSAPSNATINAQLGTSNGSSPPPNGIYVVNTAPGVFPPPVGTTINGGIYIQGNLNQCLMQADTLNGVQVFRFTQGGVTKTIEINRAANTTTVTVGAQVGVYTGVPEREVIYTNGAVSDFRGPDRVSGSPPPALLDGQKWLMASTGDIVIQRDITVEDFSTGGQAVLGIYSSGGDVRVGTGAPNDCNLDAFVMATGGGASGEGVFAVDNYSSGSPRGTFHLRGGMVAQYYGAFYTFNTNGTLKTGYARDFTYDRRGLIPPYFPTTTLFVQTNLPRARTLAWKEL